LSNQIKVLYVNQSSNFGGAEVVLANTFSNINGVSRYIIGSIDFINHSINIKSKNVFTSQYFGKVKRRKSKIWLLILLINLIPASFQILSICVNKKINIIHANNYTSLLFCVVTKLLLRVKLIWHCHETITHHKYEKKLKYLLSVFCDTIYPVSINVQDYLLAIGIRKSKLVVIHNGVLVTKEIKTLDYNNIWSKEGPINLICATSSFNSNKGIHIIIEAFNYIKKHRKDIFDQISLNIYGNTSVSINNYLNILIGLINKYDMNNKIIFSGFNKNLANEMKSYHICIIPSQYYEAFPITCLEAMSSGVLVISSQVGGLKEIIKDKVNGIAFKNSDHKRLAKKIIYAISNKSESIKIINQAQKTYKANYTFDLYLSKVLNNYKKLIK